jgi:CUB/sushi domain-containing protein
MVNGPVMLQLVLVSIYNEHKQYWNDHLLSSAVDCGSLSAPENGAVYFYPGTTFTSTASFVCRRGFRLVGSETRTCQADGSWSGVQPVCKKIKCPKLKAPQYGKLYVSGNHPGDYAVYDCGYGYKLVGKRRRTCGYNGKWSGSDADCVKDSHYGGGGYGHYGGHDY